MRVMSLLLRNRVRSEVREDSWREEMEATWLDPSCTTWGKGSPKGENKAKKRRD